MRYVINLSSLLPPETDGCCCPSWFCPDLQRQWPSLREFLSICNRYSKICGFNGGCLFGIYNLPWLVTKYMSSDSIADYKNGNVPTRLFLSSLLHNDFPFLNTVEFSDDEKRDLWNTHPKLVSLSTVEKIADLKNSDCALALLEKAWIARMQFGDEATLRVKRLSEKTPDKIILISNTNPLDLLHSIYFLKTIMPTYQWCDENTLRYNILNAFAKPISLTQDDSIVAYVSYQYGCEKTNGLLTIVQSDNTDQSITLVSHWEGDVESAKQLGLNTQTATEFFSPPASYTQSSPLLG